MKIPTLGIILGILAALLIGSVKARDDGRYANSPLKPWFDKLASGKGLCCSFADGVVVEDPDWEVKPYHDCDTNNECHFINRYRVRLDGNWIDVPDDAVITESNRAGRTMVWPMYNDGAITVRCFMPGVMT